MKNLLLLLLQIIGFACTLGLIGFIFNRFFGFNVGFKGVKAPTEWEAGLSFLVVGALCFAIVYFFGRSKKADTSDGKE